MARFNWILKLAQGIGANPSKFMGTKTNISFLGKGPTKNPLFQGPVQGLETATEASLGPKESIIGAVEDAMGYASAGKLNGIQLQALEKNLENIFRIYRPPPLPTASVTPIASGIKTVAPKPMTDIERLLKEGHTDARGRRWDFPKSRLPETGPFQGWTPRVVPKEVNIPASKINHQMIADKYGIDVELIRGKDWVEVLEILKGFTPLKHGGLARILEV